MNRLTRILSLALAAQLLLVAIVFWPQSTSKEDASGAALLSFDSVGISRVVVSDNETSLVLSRTASRWTLPEYHQLPADPAKITSALETLPEQSRGWPVAQTKSAQQRFEVSEDNYQRKLQYVKGAEVVGSVYLGTSPGFRKVHARLDGEDAIYAVEFNSFDLPVTEAEWLDQTLLQLEDIDAVQGLDYLLSREDENWSMGNGATPVQGAVDALVNGLQSLRVSGTVDIATAAILRDTEVPPTLTVTSAEKTYDYRLFQIEEARYLKRADIDLFFNVSALDYDRLNDVNAATLSGVEKEEAREEPAAEESQQE